MNGMLDLVFKIRHYFFNYIDNYFIISYNPNNSSFDNIHSNKRKNKIREQYNNTYKLNNK